MLEILSSNLVLPLLAVLASLVLLFFALPRRMPPGIQMTPWITVAALVWAMSDLAYLALPLLEQLPAMSAWFRSLGMDILPLASLLQILLLTEKIRWPNRGSLALFSCTLLLEQGLYWVFDSQSVQALGSLSAAFTLHLTLRIVPLLAAGFVLVYHFLQAPHLFRKISWFYLASSLIIGIIYITEFIAQPASRPPHISPLFADLSQVAFLVATLRYQLHAILPLTRTALMDKLGEAVIVLDYTGRFVDLNSAARRLLDSMPAASSRRGLLRQPIGSLFPELKHFFENPSQTIPSRLELEIGTSPRTRVMELSISPLAGAAARPVGWLLQMRDISRQKQEQSRQQERIRLWENQARLLDATLSASPDFTMITDQPGKFLYASPASSEFIDRRTKELEQLTWDDLNLPQPEKQLFGSKLEEAFNAKEPRSFEFQLPADPGTRYFEVYLSPFETGESGVLCMACTVREMTSRRRMEEALKESEQRYRSIVEVLDEGIVIQDHLGRVTGCNRSAQRLLGLTVDESLGKIFVDTQQLAIREDGSPFPHEQHPSMRALHSGQAQEKVIMGVQSPNLDMRWLLVNSQPLFQDDQANPYAVVSSYVDITPNKLAENALRDSHRRFETLLEFAPAAMLVVDQASRILLVNSRLEAEVGYPREQLLGRSISILVPERFRQLHISHQEKYIQNPVARQMGSNLSLFALRADGSEFPVDIGLSPIETNEGLRIICYLVDITERKAQEEALRRVNEQLSRSLADLQGHNRELILLGEMSEMLQRCETIEEAYKVSTEYAQKLFPGFSGALYLHDADRLMLQSTTSWGDSPPQQSVFVPSACWALRRSRAHTVEHFEEGLRCQHIDPGEIQPQSGFICVPMQAQGQVMGMFHLRGLSENLIRSLENLAVTFTSHLTISFLNITLRDTLRVQSVHDPLTGLHNRRYMEDALSREIAIASRYKRDLSLILFDIDHFKLYNDQHGHTFGDLLLKTIGEYLQMNLRSMDIACRYGGEEFLIILPDTPLSNGLLVARKIKTGLGQLRFDDAQTEVQPLQVSMGVTAYQGEDESASGLIQRADQALYQAKETGRNRIVTS
ncbi:MAG: hypothetical protein A2Z16_00055 [Chloroflexi bacterium RBG_16_54_18]|nr:MAG: hypothetical protein A2Z16_00055 [Chloroflexi bacterium RBG_16_54_18]